MKFFTDYTVKNDYLLIKLRDYLNKKLDFNKYEEIFIDPHVYELKKHPYYSWENDFNIKNFLNSLPKNCYFSVDYPCDMNPFYTDKFLLKSWDNAIQYCGNIHYIVTVQYKFHDFYSFKKWFNKYNDLYIASNILGLGNICRINKKYDIFLKKSIQYAFENTNVKRIHIYGLSFRALKYVYDLSLQYNIDLSIDSLKWTRACSSKLRKNIFLNLIVIKVIDKNFLMNI